MPVSQTLSLSLIDSPHQAIVKLRQGCKVLFRCVVDGAEVQLVLDYLGDESCFDAECRVLPDKIDPDLSRGFGWRLDGFTVDKKYFIALINAPSYGLRAHRHLVVGGLPLGHPIECQEFTTEQLDAARKQLRLQCVPLDKRFETFTIQLQQVVFVPARYGGNFDPPVLDCNFKGNLANGIRVVGGQSVVGCSIRFNAC